MSKRTEVIKEVKWNFQEPFKACILVGIIFLIMIFIKIFSLGLIYLPEGENITIMITVFFIIANFFFFISLFGWKREIKYYLKSKEEKK